MGTMGEDNRDEPISPGAATTREHRQHYREITRGLVRDVKKSLLEKRPIFLPAWETAYSMLEGAGPEDIEEKDTLRWIMNESPLYFKSPDGNYHLLEDNGKEVYFRQAEATTLRGNYSGAGAAREGLRRLPKQTVAEHGGNVQGSDFTDNLYYGVPEEKREELGHFLELPSPTIR